jgi:hypothetical protein
MNAEAPERRPITKARATELTGYGAHFAWTLVTEPDALTLSEALVVIATAAGVALGSVENPEDRKRLLDKFGRLALKTAAEAREYDPDVMPEFGGAA